MSAGRFQDEGKGQWAIADASHCVDTLLFVLRQGSCHYGFVTRCVHILIVTCDDTKNSRLKLLEVGKEQVKKHFSFGRLKQQNTRYFCYHFDRIVGYSTDGMACRTVRVVAWWRPDMDALIYAPTVQRQRGN